MLGLFEGSLAIGMVGLVGMAGMQVSHGLIGHGADTGHAGHIGDGGHAGDVGMAHPGDTGFGHIGHVGDVGHAGHIGDVGHVGHVGDVGHAGHVGDIAHAGHPGDIAHAGHGDTAHAGHGEQQQGLRGPLWLIPSPITVFSLMIGFGLAGMVFRDWLNLPIEWTCAIAVANAIVFERLLVRPYWAWIFRFASTPGTNLQGAVASRAIAVTSFNARGRGLVRLTVDGQDRDVLARLIPDRSNVRVRKGDVLFVERADEDNTVLVSRPDSVANV